MTIPVKCFFDKYEDEAIFCCLLMWVACQHLHEAILSCCQATHIKKQQKMASSSYLSKKHFYRYCHMATLFSSFPPDERRRILSTQPLSLADLENDSWVSEYVIATRLIFFKFLWTYFSVFLVSLQYAKQILSELSLTLL